MMADELGDAVVAVTIRLERLLRVEGVGALLHDAGTDDLHVHAGCIHLP